MVNHWAFSWNRVTLTNEIIMQQFVFRLQLNAYKHTYYVICRLCVCRCFADFAAIMCNLCNWVSMEFVRRLLFLCIIRCSFNIIFTLHLMRKLSWKSRQDVRTFKLLCLLHFQFVRYVHNNHVGGTVHG